MRQGLLFYGESNYPIRTPDAAGPGKTREQVINELRSESLKNATRVCVSIPPVDRLGGGCRKFLGIHSVGLLASA